MNARGEPVLAGEPEQLGGTDTRACRLCPQAGTVNRSAMASKVVDTLLRRHVARDSRMRSPLPGQGHHDCSGDDSALRPGPLYDAADVAKHGGANAQRLDPTGTADDPCSELQGPMAETRLLGVVLEGDAGPSLPAFLEADREQAIADIASEARFVPLTLKAGQREFTSFMLRLSIRNGRLIFDIRDHADAPLTAIGLALGPFRRLIKDYQLLVDSHLKAVEEGREARIQAIDMGRRGLHNEGASLMVRRLQGKVAIDFETARRLFTLVCVLHQRVSPR